MLLPALNKLNLLTATLAIFASAKLKIMSPESLQSQFKSNLNRLTLLYRRSDPGIVC